MAENEDREILRGHEVTDFVGYNKDFRFFLSVLEKTLIVSSATLIRACTQIYAHTQPTHLGYLTLKC